MNHTSQALFFTGASSKLFPLLYLFILAKEKLLTLADQALQHLGFQKTRNVEPWMEFLTKKF
jgi:hypothetical protein